MFALRAWFQFITPCSLCDNRETLKMRLFIYLCGIRSVLWTTHRPPWKLIYSNLQWMCIWYEVVLGGDSTASEGIMQGQRSIDAGRPTDTVRSVMDGVVNDCWRAARSVRWTTHRHRPVSRPRDFMTATMTTDEQSCSVSTSRFNDLTATKQHSHWQLDGPSGTVVYRPIW